MKKIPFFNKRVWALFSKISMFFATAFSLVAVFVPFSSSGKLIIGGISSLITCLLAIYIGSWAYLNKLKKAHLKINGTRIIIKQGDIFEETGKKVIAFNEYFDTQVDDMIIAKGSLHGQFITRYIKDIPAFDDYIYKFLRDKSYFVNSNRPEGKKIQYPLGTVVVYKDFFLIAYSRFNDKNQAYLYRSDIGSLYANMWLEIDQYKACNSISIPVLGSSRLVRPSPLTPQQLLELMLSTFRTSGINLTRQATLNIVVHSSMMEDINFAKLKDFSD